MLDLLLLSWVVGGITTGMWCAVARRAMVAARCIPTATTTITWTCRGNRSSWSRTGGCASHLGTTSRERGAEFPSTSTAAAPTREGRKRIGFQFRLTCKPELLQQYKDAHTKVWPEMQEALRRSGWHNYSLFLGSDGLMFGYFEADRSFQESLDRMGSEAINATWQDAMKIFVPDVDPDDVDAATVCLAVFYYACVSCIRSDSKVNRTRTCMDRFCFPVIGQGTRPVLCHSGRLTTTPR